ncbi:MAG: prepilin peptidase [Elusimicrobiota bacterium]
MTPLIFFIFGIEFGSFANVCIYRIPRNLSVVFPRRSFCPWCKKSIAWFDNIPILSFLFLHGRCRSCHGVISVKYPIVELLLGILWALFSFLGSFSFILPFLVLSLFLVIISFIDLELKIIPDSLSLSLIVLGLFFSVINPIFSGEIWLKFVHSIIGVLVGGGTILLIGELGKLIYGRDAMGGGDVKLCAALGAFLGWSGVVSAIIIASILGSLVVLIGFFLRRIKSKQLIPFGPFLSMGGLINLVVQLKFSDMIKYKIIPFF